MCNDLERKVRKVRDPFSHFPFISPSNNNLNFDSHDSVELNNLSQVHDEPIVKISPPTPSRKSSFTDIFNDKNQTINQKDNQLDDNVLLKLQLLKEKKVLRRENSSDDKNYLTNLQFFTKESCPFHKNQPAPQIFDDDLKKYLPSKKSQSSFPELKKSLCSLHSCKIQKNIKLIEKSQISLEIENLDKLIIKNDDFPLSDIQKPVKAPKLGKASLLASFAKTVSIPSSIETHESSDEDYSKSDINPDLNRKETISKNEKSEEKFKSPKNIAKDYLRVPKLGYASLHPSFRKLIPMDSISNDDIIEAENNSIPEIVSEYSFSFNKPKLNDIKNDSQIKNNDFQIKT